MIFTKQKPCVVCGIIFTIAAGGQRTCSIVCRRELKRISSARDGRLYRLRHPEREISRRRQRDPEKERLRRREYTDRNLEKERERKRKCAVKERERVRAILVAVKELGLLETKHDNH